MLTITPFIQEEAKELSKEELEAKLKEQMSERQEFKQNNA